MMSAKPSARATEISALQDALAAEQAAVYGYGVVGAMLANGLLWGLSAPGVRKLNAAARSLDRALLGDDVPAPPRLQSAQVCGSD